jgi:hypothetical protein
MPRSRHVVFVKTDIHERLVAEAEKRGTWISTLLDRILRKALRMEAAVAPKK